MKTLNIFYRLWLAISVPEKPTAPPSLRTFVVNARRQGKTITREEGLIVHYESTIEIYREALRPFAKMHREQSHKDMVVAERRFGDHVAVVRESDFDRAFYLLDEHNI